MIVEDIIEKVFNQFINNVEQENIMGAATFWEQSILPIFYANFKNIYMMFQGWKIRKIVKFIKVDVNTYLIIIRFTHKQNWLKAYSENNFVESIENADKKLLLLRKYRNMLMNQQVIQVYSVKVMKSKVYINWSYAALKSLIKKEFLYSLKTNHIEFYCDQMINQRISELINQLETFVTKNIYLYGWYIETVKINCILNTEYPFINKSAFLDPTSEEIFIFKKKFDIECLKHEIIHKIFWGKYRIWPKAILREGIASSFGTDQIYVSNLEQINKKVDFFQLFEDNSFWNGDSLPLVLSGLFTKFLLFRKNMSIYEKLYSCESQDILKNILHLYSISSTEIKEKFDVWIKNTYGNYDIWK